MQVFTRPAQAVGAIALSLLCCAVSRADLNAAPYTASSNIATWDGAPVYTSFDPPITAVSPQGQPSAGSGATLTCLSEVVTPSTTFPLGAISIFGSFGDTTVNQVRMHLYPLNSSGGTNFFSSSDAFYFPGTDLLANGSGGGLFISALGSGTGAKQIRFDLTNGPNSNDQVTLNAGTSYALEFWVPTAASSVFTWYRNASTPNDPGGQMMGSHNATDFGTSRNTIAALGLAGGSPRTAAVALYAVPEPASLGMLSLLGLGALRRRRA